MEATTSILPEDAAPLESDLPLAALLEPQAAIESRVAAAAAMGIEALDRAADRFEKWDPKLPARNGSATPDPGQAAPAATDGQSPASAAPAGSGAAMPPAPGVSAPPVAAEHEPGKRRLHAVRRSDTKET